MVGPAHWIHHHGVDVVTLYPPEGGGRIRVFERVRPLPRLSQVIESVARDPGFAMRAVRAVRQLVTIEGEHGAFVTLTGTRDAVPVVRFVGVVWADEFARVVDALVVVPACAGLFEATAFELVRDTALGLGERPRWFGYVPPAGWTPLPVGLATHWYAPGFPADASTILVPPAVPSRGATPDAVETMVARERARGFEVHGPVDERAVVGHGGLAGRRHAFTFRSPTRAKRHVVVTLAAGSHGYTLELETGVASAHVEVFDALVASIEPVPAPGARSPTAVSSANELFAHLLD